MTYYLTKEKKKELEEELKKLTTEARKEIAERLDEAKALGDLKENAEYHQAREDQGKLEGRIQEIEAILQDAEIIKNNKKRDTVELGAKVELKKDGKKVEYEIVGRAESDFFGGKIAVDSPLAQVLIGKKVGEKVEFVAPNGNKNIYEVLKIS